MSTVQALLDDINLRYRNTFTTDQLVKWMDMVQRQIFQDVKHEAPPYNFTTLSGVQSYGLPNDCDPMGVKVISIETKTGSGKYNPLDFIRFGSNELVSDRQEFYTIVTGGLFLSPAPTDQTAGRNVFVYYNKRPAAISSSDLMMIPDLNEDYHELLVWGTLERIAAARKDSDSKTNYANEFTALYQKYRDQYDNEQPEYNVTKDKLPRRGLVGTGRRKQVDLSMMPWG